MAHDLTSVSPPGQFSRYALPWPVVAALSAGLVLWGLSRIVPDVMVHAYGRVAEATVVNVAKKRSSVWIDFEARTANAGTIRGSDMLNTAWPPAVGDRIEVLYLAVGHWRHAVVTSNRNWLNPVFVPSVALGFGILLGAAALVVRRERRTATRPPA